MAEVSIAINGRNYNIDCDPGQEGHVAALAAYADSKLQQIARNAGSWDEKHLLVLASLVLADEVFRTREDAQVAARSPRAQPPVQAPAPSREDEQIIARALGELARRIEGIAQKVQAA